MLIDYGQTYGRTDIVVLRDIKTCMSARQTMFQREKSYILFRLPSPDRIEGPVGQMSFPCVAKLCRFREPAVTHGACIKW